ncbi:hypothetical protein FRC00_004520 [Tulasnella sp. 408]|nr:hypothetical protein FRC00_004520 [Tulasnella sp. 408]
MVLFGLLDRRSAREGTEPPSTPVSQSKWSAFKSKLSRRREQSTEEPTTLINPRVSSDVGAIALLSRSSLLLTTATYAQATPNEAYHQEPSFFRQTAEPNPEDYISLGSRAESSESSRPVTPSSEASSSLSKYNYMFFAPLRASMIDEAGSVEHESPPLESQEDDGADRVVESSMPQAPIVPLDPAASEAPVSLVEGIEGSSIPAYEPACALECFIASSPYGGDDISVCLRGGSAAKSRRAAFCREDTRATTKSAQLAKYLLASEDVDTRNVTGSIVNDLQPANTPNKSASDEFQPSPTVAPVVTSPSQAASSWASPLSTFSLTGRAHNHRQVVDRTKNSSASGEARPSLTVAPVLPLTSSPGMVIRAPKLTPIRELVSEDYPESLSTSSSLRGNDQETNVPSKNQDLVDRTFATAKYKRSTVTVSSENHGRQIKTEANTSASGEDVASPTAAPIGSTPLLHRQLAQAPSLSTFNRNGSAGNDGQTVDGIRKESAGPSVVDAPITSIPLSRLNPRKVVRDAAPPVWSQLPQHARKIKLRITSKLRQWGNGASNVLRVRRRTGFEAAGGRQAVRNGHSVAQDTSRWTYDPWQGLVPPSESSFQIDVNYSLADPWPVPTESRVELD